MSIKNRLAKNYKHLSRWARKNDIEAWRLYSHDIPDFPFTVDIYKDHLVVWYHTSDIDQEEKKREHPTQLIEALIEVCEVDNEHIHIKERFRQKNNVQYERITRFGEELIIKEGSAVFLVNLTGYLDTGIFLDHRPMRQLIYDQAKNKKILNLFSYTCSVSVMGALGGGTVSSVDMSKTYLDWGRKNFELNQLSLQDHEFINQNVLDYLTEENRKFDLIFLDPPTFSNSKKMDKDFEVERDQFELISLCARLLNDGGVLYFSNNKKNFKLNSDIESKFVVKDITGSTIPEDFKRGRLPHCVFRIQNK